MRSSTRDTPPAQVPAGQVASEAPAAGNARVTAVAGLALTAAVVLGLVVMYRLQLNSADSTIQGQLRTYATQIEQSAASRNHDPFRVRLLRGLELGLFAAWQASTSSTWTGTSGMTGAVASWVMRLIWAPGRPGSARVRSSRGPSPAAVPVGRRRNPWPPPATYC